jgi:type IV secretory pathway VirB10-like protein
MSVMAENEIDLQTEPHPEPELRQTKEQPKGVLQKNLKTFVYLGAALLVIVAAFFSSNGKKAPSQQAAKGQPPQPMLQDNTENNVWDLKNQVQVERQKDQQAALAAAAQNPAITAATTPAQQAAAAAYGPSGVAAPCAPGQPCPQAPPGNGQPNAQPQLTPLQQQMQELAAKDRERADESRFASNLVYTRTSDQQQRPAQGPQQTSASTTPPNQRPADTSLVSPHAPGDPPETTEGYKRPVEANIDSAMGQPYLVYEGTVLDTILMNRLDGDAPGPVKVLVSEPLYSHDRQHVLIPDGTIALGEAKKIGAAGFGQQRRVAIVFHRLIMPDGYSMDLDQFHGLDQIGEEGAKDKVNNHYLQIFGTSIALGLVAGAGEIEQGGGAISTSGSQSFTTGAAGSVSQSATTILDRFMQISPTITIREGHRIKVYFTQDMLLPAYTNHTISQTF